MTTYFVDNDLRAIAKALAAVRSDVVYPGHGIAGVEPDTLDPDWLPIIGQRGLVVVSRDKRFRYKGPEIKAFLAHNVRAFVMTGAGNMNSFDTLRLLLANWQRMEAVVAEEDAGPWLWSVTKGGVSKMKLPSTKQQP